MKWISVILNFFKNIHIEKDIHKYLQKNRTWRLEQSEAWHYQNSLLFLKKQELILSQVLHISDDD